MQWKNRERNHRFWRLKENAALSELARFPQWVVWRYKEDNKGKTSKVPYNPRTRRLAQSNEPKTWGTYEAAAAASEEHSFDGVGFVFTPDDAYFGVDLDGCYDPKTGTVEPWAAQIVEALDSYTEVSPSGMGLHIIGRGSLPGPGRNAGRVEIYDQGRYFSVTGAVFEERSLIQSRTEELSRLYGEYAPALASITMAPEDASATHAPVTLEDEELLERARNTGQWHLFRRLYDAGDWEGYPSQSEADLRLCIMLAFWTGRDPEQMDRLFRVSALMRKKWNEKRGESTYGARTIEVGIACCPTTYTGKPKHAPSAEVLDHLTTLENWAAQHTWPGEAGPRKRCVFGALIDTGRVWAKPHPEGVTVRAACRDIALAAGIGSSDSVRGALSLLEVDGVIRCLDRGTSKEEGGYAATYLLKATHPRYVEGPPHPCLSMYRWRAI